MLISSLQQPDKVTNIIIQEKNKIVNKIAPPRKKQTKKDVLQYHTEGAREFKHEVDQELNVAKTENKNKDWRYFGPL